MTLAKMSDVTKAPPRRAAAIMFTDIERFTETTERLGDAAAHRLLMTHNMIVRSRLAAHSGRELKSMGDGFLVVFPSIVQAVGCAATIQSDFAEHNTRNWERLDVRIGIHAGGVIRERTDVYGRNVILAARIAELARGGEVLVSAPVRAVASSSGRFKFDEGRVETLAGIAEQVRIYTLL
jgi:class 3 adenylate cyclase